MKSKIEEKALKFCLENKHRYTDPRRNVLKIISESKQPLKAYEILEKLSLIMKNPKPPTAYRAIDFWRCYNFIHRIESLNAYAICEADHLHSGSQFMICDDCGEVTEAHFCEIPQIIKKDAKRKTFKPTRWNIEINGVCRKCS